MKPFLVITGLCALFPIALTAEEPALADTLSKHKEGSVKVAADQDELSADVQQLVIEQTMPKVIELFNEAEKIMDEATDRLDGADTGGETIAAQTEIIEKIYEAAKEKQKQGKGGQSKPGGAMMDMMERMKDGEKPGDKEGKGKGKGKGNKPSEEGGKGKTGLSDTANDANSGDANGKSEARRVPKAGGNTTLEIPEEFRKAFDAYNRGAEKKVK
ncbi:MAG: hypothetical protein WCS43_18255 [Verrucomicrobiota bacterium]